MALVLNMPEFRIYQGCEYARVTHRSEYAWIYWENSWICLIIPVCLNVPKYAGICATMSMYTLMVFVLHFLGGPLERLVTNFNIYPKLE